MLKSILYKEWLKIRWFLGGYTLLGVFGIGYLFLAMRHSFVFSDAPNIWSTVLFQNQQFFSLFKYVPLAGGVIIALSQYLPEAIDKRLKLTFHLPVRENKVLAIMVGFGAGSLLISFLIFFSLLNSITLVYFPLQVMVAAISTVLPWFFAGFSAYFMLALVILEPNWLYRFFYALISVFFLTGYFASGDTEAYLPANAGLCILTVLLSTTVLFSAYRFRKGEM